MRKLLVIILGLGCGTLALTAQDGAKPPLFRARFAPVDAPRFGFTNPQSRTLEKRYTVKASPTGGPKGGPAVTLSMLGVSGSSDPDCAGEGRCEGYVGWGEPNPMPEVPQGEARYIRIHLNLACPIGFTYALDGTGWGGKFIMMGDGADSGDPDDHESRIIWNLEAGRGSSVAQFKIQKNLYAEGEIRTRPIACGEWHSYQLKVQSSSKYPGGKDGRMSLYIDNDVEKSPTIQGGRFDVSTGRWDDSFKLGAYVLWAGARSNVAWQISALEIDDKFDASWHASIR